MLLSQGLGLSLVADTVWGQISAAPQVAVWTRDVCMAFGYLGHRHRQAYGLRHGPGSSMGPDNPMASGVSSNHLDQHVPSPLPELMALRYPLPAEVQIIDISGGNSGHRQSQGLLLSACSLTSGGKVQCLVSPFSTGFKPLGFILVHLSPVNSVFPFSLAHIVYHSGTSSQRREGLLRLTVAWQGQCGSWGSTGW